MKTFGDKMEAGDQVVVHTWAYTLNTGWVRNVADLKKPGKDGLKASIVRVVDRNAVVVRFNDGYVAPVHPTAITPGV